MLTVISQYAFQVSLSVTLHPKSAVNGCTAEAALLTASHLSTEIIVFMDICRAPTPWLKALNKHNDVTHIMYIEMENVISNLRKTNT